MSNIINNYRSRKLKDKYFVTTDHGSSIVLTDEEFKKLKSEKIDSELKKKLEEKQIILSEKNVNETIRLTQRRNEFLFSGTGLHIIVLTRRCNMNCVYCHASAKSESENNLDMDIETAKKTVDFIFQSPNNNITIEFQGGEPLLNWETLKYIIEYSQEKNKSLNKNLKIDLVSNFSLMNEEKMNYIIEKNVGVCTSLDGPEELHNINRSIKSKDNYTQVTTWLKRFNSEYEKRGIRNQANALVTLTRKSLDYPHEIVQEYIDNGLNQIHLRFLNNLGTAKKAWEKINYDENEFMKFWQKAMKKIDEFNKKGITINERTQDIILSKINNETDPNFLEMRSPCGAAIGQLAYNHNGDIYTCDEARMIDEDLFMLGNVHNNNYKEVVTSNKACAVSNASINDQYVCDNCAYKPYCGVCPVCNYSEQGSVIAKITETSRCKIFMKQFDYIVTQNFIKENNQ